MFESLKNALFEEEPQPETKAAPKAGATPAPVAKPTPVYVTPGQVDPEIRARLMKAIEPAAQPALTALQASLNKLSQAIPDPTSRLNAALALLDGTNNPGQVLVDIQEALTALAEQERKALELAESARKQQIGSIEQQISTSEARLQAIATEKSTLEASLLELRTKHGTESQRIQATLGSITTTAAAIRQELQSLAASIGPKGS